MELREPALARFMTWLVAQHDRLRGVYERRARGPLRMILGFVLGITSRYRLWVWDRWARNGDGQVTRKRAGWTIFATLVFLWFLPAMLLTGWQAGLMATTMRNEEVFLTMAEEVDPENEVHSIRGCRAIPCTESDAVYFRVRASWMHEGYSLIKQGHMFYPEEVAGVVAPGVNRCQVTSYGIRVKAMMRGWGIYPDMLNAVCTPWVENGSTTPVAAKTHAGA